MDLKRYARYLSMAALLIVMSCSGCSLHPEQSYNKSTIAMDTTIQLRAEGKEAKEAVEEGLERVHQLDSLASAQNPDSDISRINAAAGQSYVQVDPSVYEMIAIAKEYSEKTQGAWTSVSVSSQNCGISEMMTSMFRPMKKLHRP